jgi:phosphoribosylglycinamide formyltransferase 2
MVTIGTPLSPHATRVLLLGSGELGKEVAIELQRFGVEVIAADRYANAPAMQVAHRSHVLDMLDGDAVRALIAAERPHLIVPEIEAIDTQTLVDLERELAMQEPEERGTQTRIIPTARAAWLTMDREGIRRLAAETLDISLCRDRSRLSRCGRRDRLAVRGQASDVVIGPRPERRA